MIKLVTAYCKCNRCGKECSKSAIATEDDIAELWVKNTEAEIFTCPDCTEKCKKIELAKNSEYYTLPNLTGPDEKSTFFAEALRADYVLKHKAKVESAAVMIKYKIQKSTKWSYYYKRSNVTKEVFDDFVGTYYALYKNLYKEYICLTENRGARLPEYLIKKRRGRKC